MVQSQSRYGQEAGIITRQIQIYWVCNLVISRHWGRERNILHIGESPNILTSTPVILQSNYLSIRLTDLQWSSYVEFKFPIKSNSQLSQWLTRNYGIVYFHFSVLVNIVALISKGKSYSQTNSLITVYEGKLAWEAM